MSDDWQPDHDPEERLKSDNAQLRARLAEVERARDFWKATAEAWEASDLKRRMAR